MKVYLKKALQENSNDLWILIRNALFFNRPQIDYKFDRNLKTEDQSASFIHVELSKVSKIVFFRAMGWIFPVPGFEKSIDTPVFSTALKSIEILTFMEDYFSGKELTGKNVSSISRAEKEKYLKFWSSEVFSKDLRLTKKDVLCLLEWCWENRDVIYDFWPYPLSFAYSRYYDEDKAFNYYQQNVKSSRLGYESDIPA